MIILKPSEFSQYQSEQVVEYMMNYDLDFIAEESVYGVGEHYEVLYNDMSYGIVMNFDCIWDGKDFRRTYDNVALCGVIACNKIQEAESMTAIKIKKLSETAVTPKKGSAYAAGYDLCADIDHPVTIKPHETVMLQTNIALEIPEGYFGGIYPRSGLSTREGLRLANCVGIIDSDYRGSVGVPMHNDSNCERIIVPSQRIAQIIVQKAESVFFEESEELSETARGNGGFGSTGE